MLAVVLVLTNCQQDGSGEKAGKKVDQTIEKANKQIEKMGEAALNNISKGARVVGGCCGSSPEHVAGIARAVKSMK